MRINDTIFDTKLKQEYYIPFPCSIFYSVGGFYGSDCVIWRLGVRDKGILLHFNILFENVQSIFPT